MVETLDTAHPRLESYFDPESIAEVESAFATIAAELQAKEPEGRTTYESVSEATHNIVTPGNTLSVIGVSLTVIGSNRIDTPLGAGLVIAGRTVDLVDGPVARKTNTASPTGEAIDATGDKIANFKILYEGAKSGTLSPGKVAFIGAQNIANAAIAIIAKKRGRELHSSKEGKHGTAASGITIGAELVRKQLDEGAFSRFSELLDDASFGVTVELGVRATYDYFKEAFSNEPISQHKVMLKPEQIRDLFKAYLEEQYVNGGTNIEFVMHDTIGNEIVISPGTVAAIAKGYTENESVVRSLGRRPDQHTTTTHFSLDGTNVNPALEYPYSMRAAKVASVVSVGAALVAKGVEGSPVAQPLARKLSRMAAGSAIYHAGGSFLQPKINSLKQSKHRPEQEYFL